MGGLGSSAEKEPTHASPHIMHHFAGEFEIPNSLRRLRQNLVEPVFVFVSVSEGGEIYAALHQKERERKEGPRISRHKWINELFEGRVWCGDFPELGGIILLRKQ